MSSPIQHTGLTTVFLTQQETDRIRTTAQSHWKQCSELKGQPRIHRAMQDAIREATAASLMADMGATVDPNLAHAQGTTGKLPIMMVGNFYPPCSRPSSELEAMTIADLRMETHHRGRKLVVKCVSPVVMLTARSWTMVTDKEGIRSIVEAERLELVLHTSRYSEDILETGEVFVIKEPYFTITEQGEATIRIDHPSDIIFFRERLPLDDVRLVDTEQRAKAALKLKEEGNAALKRNELPLAHEKYTSALKFALHEAASKPDLAKDIHRNRALVNLQLGRFWEAKTDAEASLIGSHDARPKMLDAKAYYRAGCAAYALQKYDEAQESFQKQQALFPGDKDASRYLAKIKQRKSETDKGVYDWKGIRKTLTGDARRVDAATHIQGIEVGESPGKGRGYFAQRDIQEGELLICEKALCSVWGSEADAMTAITYDIRDGKIRAVPVGLTKALVQHLLGDLPPEDAGRVMRLRSGLQTREEAVTAMEDGLVIDVFRVQDIVNCNAFSPDTGYKQTDANHTGTGLWVKSALINHSCLGNASREFIGDLMVLRATRQITKGEEILHAYTDIVDYDERRANLMEKWGFECDCTLCEAERADGPAVRQKRQKLGQQAYALMKNGHGANPGVTVARAKRLVKAINGTYDAERYRNLPKGALEPLKHWLAEARVRD